MNTSAQFHQTSHVLFRAPLLRKTEASEDYSAGWGNPQSTGPVDVIDLNGNGTADFSATKNYHSNETNTVALTEPAIVSPKLERLEAFAQKSGAEVLTQDDLPQGVFVAETQCVGTENERVISQNNLRPINTLVNDLPEEFDPHAKFALDFAKGEFLIYTEQ